MTNILNKLKEAIDKNNKLNVNMYKFHTEKFMENVQRYQSVQDKIKQDNENTVRRRYKIVTSKDPGNMDIYVYFRHKWFLGYQTYKLLCYRVETQ